MGREHRAQPFRDGREPGSGIFSRLRPFPDHQRRQFQHLRRSAFRRPRPGRNPGRIFVLRTGADQRGDLRGAGHGAVDHGHERQCRRENLCRRGWSPPGLGGGQQRRRGLAAEQGGLRGAIDRVRTTVRWRPVCGCRRIRGGRRRRAARLEFAGQQPLVAIGAARGPPSSGRGSERQWHDGKRGRLGRRIFHQFQCGRRRGVSSQRRRAALGSGFLRSGFPDADRLQRGRRDPRLPDGRGGPAVVCDLRVAGGSCFRPAGRSRHESCLAHSGGAGRRMGGKTQCRRRPADGRKRAPARPGSGHRRWRSGRGWESGSGLRHIRGRFRSHPCPGCGAAALVDLSAGGGVLSDRGPDVSGLRGLLPPRRR